MFAQSPDFESDGTSHSGYNSEGQLALLPSGLGNVRRRVQHATGSLATCKQNTDNLENVPSVCCSRNHPLSPLLKLGSGRIRTYTDIHCTDTGVIFPFGGSLPFKFVGIGHLDYKHQLAYVITVLTTRYRRRSLLTVRPYRHRP